ncbi:MAG TPA: tripartite tricarboxylate transporter substrate-binding protein, partial [Burkholderiales bacterium]|nr:tripartite tricarboxylate transporter substrate-binding protein [Burkholderiales bacterium]
VQFAFNNAVVALPHIQSAKLRAIAVATSTRAPNLPDIPTIAESGLPGYEGLLFYVLVAPAKTPSAVVKTLNEAVRQIKQTAAVKQAFSTLGAVSIDMTPEALRVFLQRELEKWTKVIQTGGIQPD